MTDVAYHIVEHDGGWAYKLGDVFSETFPTRAEAEAVALRVAAEQRVPGDTETIEWQDEAGAWHEEMESGSDRPAAYVEGAPPPPAPPSARGSAALMPVLVAVGVGALVALLAKGSSSKG